MGGKLALLLLLTDALLICSIPREACPILDSGGRVVAVLAGRPSDGSFIKAADSAFQAMLREGNTAGFGPGGVKHRRGLFPALNVGISYGKGQQQPAPLKTGRHAPMLGRLIEDKNFERLATFASGK